MVSREINNYQLFVASHPQFNEWQANIMLRKDNTVVVDVRFVADPAKYASLGSVVSNGVSLIYVGVERYLWFIDVLRNEKPLWALLYPADSTMPPRMLLQTGVELAGEAQPK